MLIFSSETSFNLKLKDFITQEPLHARKGKSLNPHDSSQGTRKIKSLPHTELSCETEIPFCGQKGPLQHEAVILEVSQFNYSSVLDGPYFPWYYI